MIVRRTRQVVVLLLLLVGRYLLLTKPTELVSGLRVSHSLRLEQPRRVGLAALGCSGSRCGDDILQTQHAPARATVANSLQQIIGA